MPMSTERPPLIRSMTRPRTMVFSLYAFSTSSQTLDFFRFLFGKHDVAVTIFGIFEQDIDDIADFDRHMPTRIDELRDWNNTFRFISNVYDNVSIGDLQNRALHHFAFFEFPGAVLV